jgi:hypothetical protein
LPRGAPVGASYLASATRRPNDRADFGTYLIRAAGRGLLNSAKVLLFAATTRGCGTELLRPVANRRCHFPASGSSFLEASPRGVRIMMCPPVRFKRPRVRARMAAGASRRSWWQNLRASLVSPLLAQTWWWSAGLVLTSY